MTKDIESNSVVAGVPARKIATYKEAKTKARDYSDSFHSDSFTGDTWVSEKGRSCGNDIHGTQLCAAPA